jgi:hypothetical protein
MILSGKTPAAIANTLGVLVRNGHGSYCDQVKEFPAGLSKEEEFLLFLDNKVASLSCDTGLQDESSFIPRQLLRAKIELCRSEDGPRNLCAAISHLREVAGKHLSSDAQLLSFLLQMAPEQSEAVNRLLSEQDIQQ